VSCVTVLQLAGKTPGLFRRLVLGAQRICQLNLAVGGACRRSMNSSLSTLRTEDTVVDEPLLPAVQVLSFPVISIPHAWRQRSMGDRCPL